MDFFVDAFRVICIGLYYFFKFLIYTLIVTAGLALFLRGMEEAPWVGRSILFFGITWVFLKVYKHSR